MAPLVVSGRHAMSCPSCHRTSSRIRPLRRTPSASPSWSETQSSTACAPERDSSKACLSLDGSAPSYPKRRVMRRFGSQLTRHLVVLCLLLCTFSTALAFPRCHSGAGLAREECQDGGGGTLSRSSGTADPITSLLELVEERKKLWAQSFSKRTETTPAIHCASALYGGTRADGTLFVDVQEAANCRNLCRALLHKYGRRCAEADDPYACVLSSSSNDNLMPKEYREHCSYTRPSVQQPDFENSGTNEKCLLIGMRAWLANKHRGDMSWEWFLENVPSSCHIKSTGSKASRLALKAQTDFPSSVAVAALKKARLIRFHVISRKLQRDSGQLAESAIVPGDYWNSLSASERVDWTVTNVFYAPSDDSELSPLLQKVYGLSAGQAICLFKKEEIGGERFGMIPGRSCSNSIGVLFVAALVEYPKPDFDAEANGFDLCVARRAFQGRRVEGEVIVNPLQLKTRVTMGSPCGVSSGFDDGMWEVAFYASLYPQARGVDGIPSGGDCPWKASFQLNSKCFLKPRTDEAAFHLDFFSANEACRGLAEGSGFAAEAAGLASIESDRELNFLGEILPDGGEAWVGLYQPDQVPLVSPGKCDKYRVEEAECSVESLTSADGQGSRLSIIKSRCQAARRWPSWSSIVLQNPDRGQGDDCWLELASPSARRIEDVDIHTSNDNANSTGFFALMLFCGTGPILGGPWPLARRINLGSDSDFKDLEAGVYEVCSCMQLVIDETVVSCSGGRDFRHLRGFLRLDQKGDKQVVSGLPEVTLKSLSGAAKQSASFSLSSQPNEISPGVVYCSVDSTRRTDSTCRLTIHSKGSLERSVKLSFVPISKSVEGATVCTSPGVTMNAVVKGPTEIAVPSFVPSTLNYAICADGSFLGNLIIAVKFPFAPRRHLDQSLWSLLQCHRHACVRSVFKGLKLIFPDEQVNNAYVEVTVYGYSSESDTAAAVLAVEEAERKTDTSCSVDLLSSLTGPNRYKGDYNDDDKLLYFRFPAPPGRMKMCLLNPNTVQYPNAVSLGQTPLASVPEKIVAADARCSFPKGKCGFTLYPDPDTESVSGSPFFPKTMTIKLLKGTVTCPTNPNDPQYDSFSGDPEDSEALLSASAITMTQTYADSEVVEFSVDGVLRRWLADAGIASICMTHVGFSSAYSSCETLATCTAFLGYMRWTGPDQSDPHMYFICDEETECVVDVWGKHMNFLSMRFSRLAALEACGKLTGEGTLRMVGTFNGVNLNKLSDSSFLQLAEVAETSAMELTTLSGSKGRHKEGNLIDGSSHSDRSKGEPRESSPLRQLPPFDSEEGSMVEVPSGSSMNEHRISYILKSTKTHGTLELCWNPSSGSGHNLLDHTVSVGRLQLTDSWLSSASLGAIKVIPGATQQEEAKSVVIAVETSMDRSGVFGSTKLYFKRAPDGSAKVDSCDYSRDVERDAITTIISVSVVNEEEDDLRLAYFVARFPTEKTSMCLVQFLAPTYMSDDLNQMVYLGRLPGLMMPSGNVEIVCGLDDSIACEGHITVVPDRALDSQGSPLSLTSSIPPNLEAVALPYTSCPSDPSDIKVAVSTEDELFGERIVGEFTDSYLNITVDRTSLLLAYRGNTVLCLVDTDCKNPKSGNCVSTLGSAYWVGPPLTTSIDPMCTALKAGRCEISIRGYRMTSINYQLPRLAVADACGDPAALHWATGVEKEVEDDATLFAVPAFATEKLELCWNPHSLLAITGGGLGKATLQTNRADFFQHLGTIQFLPFPVVKRRSISRKSAVSATVILEVDALLDEKAARSIGRDAPTRGIWNHISREPFTNGSACSSNGVIVDLPQVGDVVFEERAIRDREEGSAEETGTDSTNATVAVISFELEPEVEPYTYCWQTALIGEGPQIIRQSWAPLISLPPPSKARLGGSPAETASLLGFVPCMLGTADPAGCNFSVMPEAPNDAAFFPFETPWILPSDSAVLLVPGDAECADVSSGTFETATPVDSSTLDPAEPLLLPSEPITEEYVRYRFDTAKPWLSENGSATICWASRTLSGQAVKISQALWLGPLYERDPIKVTCAQSAVCTVWVHGKNMTKLDHSNSRVAVLNRCGEANGPVHFRGQPGKVFNARCKHGTSPEFLEAYWQDTRGVCSQIDVTSLLNTHCNGAKRCLLVPVGSPTADLDIAHDSDLRVLIPDDCDDVNSRSLMGTYRCVATRAFDRQPTSLRQRVGLPPAMLQLSSRGVDADEISADQSEETTIEDQSVSYWVQREEPGLYEICWNPNIVPDLDPSSFSEPLGTLEMLPVIALVDEAVVCTSESVDSCTLEIVIESDSPVDEYRTVALMIAEQDGLDTCETITWEEAQTQAIMPHQSSWNSSKTRNSLHYTASLPMSSSKLCVVVLHNEFSEVGTVQYAGNTPGFSAPREHIATENVCTADPVEPCIVSLVPEDPSKYFALSNREPVEDESTPSFDAFDHLRPYLETSSALYGLEGDVSCPSSPQDATYQEADEERDGVARRLLGLTTNLASFDFQVTSEQKTWLSEVVEVTLCWVAHSCTEDSLQNGTRPCTKKVGMLSWAGPTLTEPLPTITCRLTDSCSFVVQGVNMSLMNHQRSRVAFLKECGGDEGPGIVKVTEFPSAYTQFPFSEQLGAASDQPVFLALKSRFAKQLKSPMKHRRSRIERLKRLEGILSMMQAESWQTLAVPESLTVTARSPVEDTVSVCWNPLLQPTNNLQDFTVKIGTVIGYGIVATDGFCTSGSTCGIEFTHRGSVLDPASLKIRAFAGQCGDPSGISEWLPNEGRLSYVEGDVYAFDEPLPFRDEQVESFSLCWCDELRTPGCDTEDYPLFLGVLYVQTMRQQTWTCLKSSNESCDFSLPETMTTQGGPSYVYAAELSSISPASCTNPLLVLRTTRGNVNNGTVNLKFAYSDLQSVGLHDKAIALCWTRQANPSGGVVPVWNSSFIGNIVLFDPYTEGSLFAGIPPEISLSVTGLYGSQASKEGLPEPLLGLYLKDKDQCSSDETTISIQLVLHDIVSSTGEPELPDEGTMSLRTNTLPVSEQGDGDLTFEDHSYGFNTLIVREQAFASAQTLRKRICYCTDSTSCSTDRLVDIGQLTITDVWDTNFRVAVAQPIEVPFKVKRPLHQDAEQRVVRVTRGSHSEECQLQTGENICRIDLRSFPEESWSSEDAGTLEYYDSGIPRDAVDDRPLPFIQLASLTPSEFVEDSANSLVFRWPDKLKLSDAVTESGLELCWKAVENEGAVSDSIADYSSKFGTVSIRAIFSNQSRFCYVGAQCRAEYLRFQNVEGDNYVKVLQGGCGAKGNEWDALPNDGIMLTESVVDNDLTLSLPGSLPIQGTTSLKMCACTKSSCSSKEEFDWHVGDLVIRGPLRAAPLVSTFATEDIRFSWAGDFDNKFYVLLKNGSSCAASASDVNDGFQRFAPVVDGDATWSGPSEGLGLLSACICHDTVAGLADPFAHPHEPSSFCEDAGNYAAKVGQLFVNGPLVSDSPLLCRTGSICHVTIRWMAMDSEEVREAWAKSRVYAQTEDCSVLGTPLLSGGLFISDDKVGEQETSADPLFPLDYELRESVFMFNNPVDIGAGSYRMCWSPEGSNAGVFLGTFTIQGPVATHKIVPVAIGRKFDVEVEMSTIVPLEQANKYRIRAYPYKGTAIFDNFDCKNQVEPYYGPDTFNCATIDGPPRSVKVEPDSAVSTLVWEDVCVIVDDLAAEATAGDMYAVCFCDGHGVGCETADRFQVIVQAWALTGPKTLEEEVQPRYRAGSRFSLALDGVDLQPGAFIGFSPAFSILTNTRYTCRSEDKEVLGKFAGTVSEDGTTVTFEDVYVPFTIPQGLLCWCPGDSCSDNSDFAVQLGRYSVAGPTFTLPRTVVGSYFTVQLIGPSLHRNDLITIRSPRDTCGAEDTENMDPEYIMEEENRTLNSLGTVESFSTTDNNLSGEKEMTWTSWGMRVKETEDRYLKICYCSATLEESCGSPGSTSVLAGLLEVRGPSRGDVELVASEEHGEYLIVRGTNLSTRNLLRYFQYPGQDAPTAEEEVLMCSNPINQEGGETTFPDAVNAAGTEQYFSVTVAPGKQYVACWSFGEDTTSVASSMTRQRMAPSFLGIEELLRARRNLATNEESPELTSATEALNNEEDDSATEEPEAQYIRAAETQTTPLNAQKWFFVSIFSQTGFQQGIHNVVLGYPDTVVVNGVVNATDTYSAVLGKSHQMHDCTEIFNDSDLQSDIGITTFAVAESRVVLKTEAATQVGWHKLCIKNQTASEIFNAGTVEVTPYFLKTGADMYDTRRTFVLPCVTARKNASGGEAWTKSQVWLPDGTGLWTANVAEGEPGTTRQYSTLNVAWPPETNFKEFPQLRNVLACDTMKDQTVLVLGATHMLVIYPDSSGRESVLINHGVPYPADVTSAGDQVFITSFDSHLITSFSLQQPKKIIFYEPTEPTLLSAGGIQAIQNIDGEETSIFVADTVGGIIGRLLISSDDLNKNNGSKINRKWTAVFGKQKSDFRNADGVNRPFCVGEFVTNYSTQEKMNPLLLVGELISDRVTFLSLDDKGLSFYRQINLGVTKFITGLRVVDDVMLLTSKQWSVEQELGKAEVIFVTFSQLIDNVYFTYPDFTKQLQAGLRYRFLPLVTGQEIQFFKEDAVAGDPLDSMGFTLDSKTGEIQGTLTATVTSRVVIVGGDLLGSYTWSFEFEAGCQSGEYFNDTSNRCEPCPLGTFRDEEIELQKCWDYKTHSTTLQTGSTNLSQCACVEGYEIGHLGTCQPCPAGTYKAIVADSNCTGRCPQHMSSEKTGADSLEALNCQCDPGFYLADDDCQSCQVGTYCAGNLSPPVQCPAFQTTSGPASSSSKDCVCTAGYYRRGEECVPCGLLTYKPLIGDQACTACPQPAASAASNQLILASSSPDSAMFSSKKGATQQSDCPKGYGRAANRNPLDLTLSCTPCPYNYFQHVEGADTECIPCPANSMTKTTMSKSITSCVAMPGFSALENLQALTGRDEDTAAGDSGSTSFLDAIELIKDVEKAYETLSEEDILSISVFCKEGHSIVEYDMAEFVTTLYTSSLAECQTACLKNVYCTSFSFNKEDSFPTHTNSIMNYTGIYPYDFWPCQLYLFGSGAATDVQDWTDIWEGTEVEPGKAVGCVVGRVTEELTWQRLRYIECPPNAYCPGDKEANIVECKDYAVTLGPRAYSSEHCLCVPGREPVGHACEQCKLGYYKNTTENVACTECPQFFTTSITASTSAYECACQPGMYMAPAGTAEDANVGEASPEEPSVNELETAAVETMVHARSLRDLGRHGELQSAPSEGVSMAELLQLPWLEEESREQLEKVVELGVCVPCHKGMYCPGLWKDFPTNSTHMPPQQCIEGSSVPLSTVNADSVEKCLCLAGYAYGRSSDVTSMSSDSYFTCSKCSPGTYKELQENAPCSGRCMKDAETFPGAVSKSQCFCQVGRYAVEANDSEGLFSCVECVSGGVCIGGLKENVIRAIEENPRYANITISDHTIPYPQKGWFATFKPLSEALWNPATAASRVDSLAENPGILDAGADQSAVSDAPSSEEFFENEEASDGPDKPMAFLEAEYDRVPDIHACPIDYRCHGGPTNSCAEGGTGYLCGKCQPGYDVAHFGTVCTKCDSIWVEVGGLFASRLVICIVVWIIAAVSCLAVQNPACIHPILIRIWISNFFLFFLFGFFPENSASALAEWAPIYRAVFAYPVFVFTKYPKMFCILRQLGIPVDYRHSWYLQRFALLLVPVGDICILIFICGISLLLYKLYKYSKIQRVKLVLSHAREVHAGDVWAMRTVEKIQGTRCLGLFHYISPPSATFRQKVLRFFGDLVPAFMIIWFWNLPFLVIECTQLLGCVPISYKDEPSLIVLTALPEQSCSFSDPWFLAGLVIGASGILVWGIGSVIVFCVWMLYTDNADNLESRFRYGFLSNGYEFQYRAWEMLLMARKLMCACLLTLQLQMNTSGTQEIFRNSINLLIATSCLILQLLIEPYDRRSHNLTNRVEFMGLLTNVVNCIIIQGSFSFSVFKWLGPFPIITCGLFHTYIFWSLFVEAGRMVLMRPHLARLPSPWRYFNLVTRSLARLYTRGNAKVYYNYITKEMVLEAAAKSRVFHLRRLIQRKKKHTDYRKINYENRTYFVSALTDSLSRLVICWCQFTIPGDWLDFTIRYSFCYCFWMRHRAASLREPLDLDEFDALRPSLFNECYVEAEDGDDDGFLGSETQCNEVEAEFLDMMVDDDVYDDSPITLMELYIAVQSMRYIPKGQLRRLHMWYRERMAAAAGSDIPNLRRENEELEAELQQLGDVLRSRFGATGKEEPSFSVLDFFFTVEMVHEAEEESLRIKKEIDREITNILNARAARAVAERVHRELEKTEGEELEDILKSVEDDIAERQEKTKDRTEYLEPALRVPQKKVKTREKPSRAEAQESASAQAPAQPESKRRMARLTAKRMARVSIAEERKRLRRPGAPGAGTKGEERATVPTVAAAAVGVNRTLGRVGYSGSENEAPGRASRRRISLNRGEPEKAIRSPSESSQERPSRRISLSVAAEQSGDSDSGSSQSGAVKRTLKVASPPQPAEADSSSERPVSPKRTLRSASQQSFSESPSPPETQRSFGEQGSRRIAPLRGDSTASLRERRTLSPLGSTVERPEIQRPDSSPKDGGQSTKRTLGRLVRKEESEEDKSS
ncbi:hypothetical protein Emed_002778 [Eimeria media]